MKEEYGTKIASMLYSVVKLGIPEALNDSAKSIAELCEGTSVIPEKLERVLYALESLGIFGKDRESEKWQNTPKSLALLSLKNFVIFQFCPFYHKAYSRSFDSLFREDTATVLVYNSPFFRALEENPPALQDFQNLMVELTQYEEDYTEKMNMENIGSILDVGGGHGALMLNMKKRHPNIRTGILEREEVVPSINRFCEKNQVDIEVHEGNFFESVPKGYESIVMKYILHDWLDTESIAILKNCREALETGQSLFILDMVVNKQDPSYQNQRRVDIVMMITVGGKERTEEEFSYILDCSGFKIDSIILGKPKSVIKAIAI